MDGTAPLTARITVNSSRAEFSLGKKIPPDCWDQEAELVKGPAATKELSVINKLIAQARIRLETLYFYLSSQHSHVTAAMLKKAYKGDPYEEKERERTICQVANYKHSIFARQVWRQLRSANT